MSVSMTIPSVFTLNYCHLDLKSFSISLDVVVSSVNSGIYDHKNSMYSYTR